MDLQKLINSSHGLQFASTLARTAPAGFGHRLADFIADLFARQREARVVRAIRLNQWMAGGQILQGAELDAAVRKTFRHSARAIFDLYHYIDNMEGTTRLISLDEGSRLLVDRDEFEGRGLVAVGIHMSNFDLVLRWMCKRGLKPLVLTIPDPQGARRLEYDTRRKLGMNLLPASIGALRHSVKHLQQGGVVVTGLDRPISNPPACPRLFGYPASLPMHHVYLARKAGVPVQIFAALLQPDGRYHVVSSDRIEMDSHPDRDIEAIQNAEKVLSHAEQLIRRAPDQWLVPLPVWPDRMDLVPS